MGIFNISQLLSQLDWDSALLGGAGGAILGSAGIKILDWFLEKFRRCHFFSDEWRFEPDCDFNVETGEQTPKSCGSGSCSFSVRFFNKKSVAIGLHQMTIEFTKRRIPSFCRGVIENTPVLFSGSFRGVDVVTLKPDGWTKPDRLCSSVNSSVLSRSKYAWLTAKTAEGKRKRWLITKL